MPKTLLRRVVLSTALLPFAACATLTPPSSTVTDEHTDLLQSVGSWEGKMTLFIPGQDPVESDATEEIVGVGRLWVHSRFECTLMEQPYVGTGSLGYDPTTKSFVGTWVDGMSSHLSVMRGEKEPTTDAVVMRWESPNEKGEMTPHRSVTIRTKNSSTSTFYEGAEGRKSMVIEMRRKAQ